MTWSIQNIEIGRAEDEEASVGKGRFFLKKSINKHRAASEPTVGDCQKVGTLPKKTLKVIGGKVGSVW